MNPCSGTAPQKRPDPGHNAPPWGARRASGSRVEGIAMTDTCANTRSTTLLWSKRLKQAAWGAACGLMLLAAAQGTARAEDDDDQKNSIWNLDTRVYQGFMSALGLRNGSEESIEYRERSPLVVPPSRNLPRPRPRACSQVQPGRSIRTRSGARRPRRPRPSGKPPPTIPMLRLAISCPASSIARGPARFAPVPAGTATTPKAPRCLPSQLGYFGGLFSWSGFGFGMGAPKDEVGTFTREPPRAALTAPPVGYQTPSPAAPYGVTKRIEYGKAAKPDLAVGDLGAGTR